MTTSALSSSSPVDSFDHCLADIRKAVRKHAPFTFIAYRSLSPDENDDWYFMASKVAWFVFLIFNFTEITAACISPLFILVPFVPFALDAIWTVYRHSAMDALMPSIPPRLLY